MKRLLKVDIGGVPYVNSDFTEIFQNEHLKAYAGILDGMNKNTYGTSSLNSGIILTGCTVSSYNGSAYQMNFYNSIIYLNGEFYQWNSNSDTSTTISSGTFYLYNASTFSESRYLRDLSTTTNVVESAYFTWSLSEPTKPYVKFSNGGTSRRFSRILKYFTSRSGDIYMCSSTSSFSATGLGFNDMEGFIMLNQYNSDIVPDLSGKFHRSYSGSDQNKGILDSYGVEQVSLNLAQTPPHIHQSSPTTYSMYHTHAMLSSMESGATIEKDTENLPSWGRAYSEPSYGKTDFYSYDIGPVGNKLTFIDTFAKQSHFFARENDDSLNSDHYYSIYSSGMVDSGNGYTTNPLEISGEMKIHVHTFSAGNDIGNGAIGTDGAPHDNRPDYNVVVYYTKKYDFIWRD